MTCVRGASALEDLLKALPGKPVAALVIWETVGPAPSVALPPLRTRVLARVRDPRAAQLWDPRQLVSSALREAAATQAGWPARGLHTDSSGTIWDTVLVFPPGSRWTDAPPKPVYAGSLVEDVMDEVRKNLH